MAANERQRERNVAEHRPKRSAIFSEIFERNPKPVRLTGSDTGITASRCPDPGREVWTVNPTEAVAAALSAKTPSSEDLAEAAGA